MGVRARDPVQREEFNPELSVPLCPLLPRGPGRRPYPWPRQSALEGSLPGPAWALYCGEEMRWSWQQNSQALVAGLDQVKLDQEAAIRDLPAPNSWAPDCRQVPPPCSQPRAMGLSSSRTPPRASARSSAPHHGSMVYLFSPAHPQQMLTWAWESSVPPPLPPPSVLSCPLFIYWAGGGVRTQAEEIPHVPGQGGVTVIMVWPPSPGWG